MAEIINEFTQIISMKEKKIIFRLLQIPSNEEKIIIQQCIICNQSKFLQLIFLNKKKDFEILKKKKNHL